MFLSPHFLCSVRWWPDGTSASHLVLSKDLHCKLNVWLCVQVSFFLSISYIPHDSAFSKELVNALPITHVMGIF